MIEKFRDLDYALAREGSVEHINIMTKIDEVIDTVNELLKTHPRTMMELSNKPIPPSPYDLEARARQRTPDWHHIDK